MNQTKSQNITKRQVWEAYKKVRANRGSAGVNSVDFKTLGKVGKYELVYFINDTYEQVGKSKELEFH